jgi:hypothetical protein
MPMLFADAPIPVVFEITTGVITLAITLLGLFQLGGFILLGLLIRGPMDRSTEAVRAIHEGQADLADAVNKLDTAIQVLSVRQER